MSEETLAQILANTEQTLANQADFNKRLEALEAGTKAPEVDEPAGEPAKDNARPLPATDLQDLTCFEVWGGNLSTSIPSSANRTVELTVKEGMSIGFLVPKLTGTYELTVTDKSTANVIRYGVLSNTRSFDAPFYDDHSWGVGGGVTARLGMDKSWKNVYFNLRADDLTVGHNITLQFTFRKA